MLSSPHHTSPLSFSFSYWLDLRPQSAASVRSGTTQSSNDDGESNDAKRLASPKTGNNSAEVEEEQALRNAVCDKTRRLIEWNVDVLARLLKQIQARRQVTGSKNEKFEDPEDAFSGGSIIEEVKEIITLPHFSKGHAKALEEVEKTELDENVMAQLRDYVATIANL